MIGLKRTCTIAFAGCVAFGVIANGANAVIVMTITDNGTDLTMTATGTYDLSLATLAGSNALGVNAAIAPLINGGVFGWETGASSDAYAVTYAGSFTAFSNTFPASSVSTTNPFYFWMGGSKIVFASGAATIGSVNEVAVFNNVTLASIGMVAGETITVSWQGDSAIITTGQIPAPGALALLGMGLLTSRRRRR